MTQNLRLMGILAHPDDESLAFGGTLARYAAEGVEISLVVATRGERGWRGSPEEDPGGEALGHIREKEVREASSILGVASLSFLDYYDGDLDLVPHDEVITRLVKLIRYHRPQVIVTFGPDGLYGHPDHIAISQFSQSAIAQATNPDYPPTKNLAVHHVSKLYQRMATDSWFVKYTSIFGDLVMHIDGRERRSFPWPEWAMTTRLDTTPYWSRVWQAVCCHTSQLPDWQKLQTLTEAEQQELWGPQDFYRAFSLVNAGRNEEHDLFDGLRLS